MAGEPVGIGAVVLRNSELRAYYVAPSADRRGVGTALVEEIERIAAARARSRTSRVLLNGRTVLRRIGLYR